MGRYLDIARALSEQRDVTTGEPGRRPDGVFGEGATSVRSVKIPVHRRLVAAGWEAKARCGKTIWASPQTGYWYSEEMAVELLRLDEDEEEGGG